MPPPDVEPAGKPSPGSAASGMKAVILAGGYGTRISEESHLKPKPMIEIGGMPILWHVLKLYSGHGITDFVICTGYRGYVIKEYFSNYFLHMADVTFDMAANTMEIHRRHAEPWRITLVDTGLDTMTGGRLKRVGEHVAGGTFCMTYGDGISDVDIGEVIAFHGSQKALATVTAVQPRSALRSAGNFRRPGEAFRGEAQRRWRLDQWRLLRARTCRA